jgi:hypothetical protein
VPESLYDEYVQESADCLRKHIDALEGTRA